MRFMAIVKATNDSETGVMPSTKLRADRGQFNEKLVNAGMMLAGDGQHLSLKRTRVKFSRNKQAVIDGPFAETKG